jgi:hypothetical protein
MLPAFVKLYKLNQHKSNSLSLKLKHAIMKKIIIITLLAAISFIKINAQNFLTPAGNAGVGSGTTEPPEAKFLVISDRNIPQLLLVQSNQNDYSRIRLANTRISSNRYWDIASFTGGAGAANDRLDFWNGGKGSVLTLTGDGNVGINNSSPKTALSFPALLGKKITLYPGNTGDVGFGVAGNRLQIYSDNPNADVAIGYDAAGNFNEKFAFKPNGALAVKSNTGNPGQVLTSGGSGASAEWKSPVNFIFKNSFSSIQTTTFTIGGNRMRNISGLSNLIEINGKSKILINYQVLWKGDGCLLCPAPSGFADVLFDGLPVSRTAFSALGATPASATGSILLNPTVTGGTHTIDLRVTSTSAHDILITGATQGSINFGATNMSVLIITE